MADSRIAEVSPIEDALADDINKLHLDPETGDRVSKSEREIIGWRSCYPDIEQY
jgi:hypothetical protein